LHKGNVVVEDNAGIFADQMRDYLDYLSTSSNYSGRYVQVGDDGLEIGVRSQFVDGAPTILGESLRIFIFHLIDVFRNISSEEKTGQFG
jgi:hypothetical protein